METKHLIWAGLIVLVLAGLLWLKNLLPGLGFGLGGKGPGEGGQDAGPANGQHVQPPPKPGEQEEVLVSGDKAVLKSNNQAVTPQQLSDWTKAGRKFVVRDKGDAQDKTMKEFHELAKKSEGRIIVKE